MGKLDSEQIMNIALDLAGFSKIPEDSGIHVPGRNLKKILLAMDVNVGLLFLAKQMGFDGVIGHHPCGVLYGRGEVYRRHLDLMERYGIERETIPESLLQSIDARVHRMENQRFRMLYNESPNQTVLETDAARMLNLPLMNVHNPLDETGRQILQTKIDEMASGKPHWKLRDVLTLVEELPEARYARDIYGISPRIFVGDPNADASKVAFVHGALVAPDAEIIGFYWKNGIKTVIMLHGEFETIERLRREGAGNLICTGHFCGDSIGITPFIQRLREKGLEVVCMGGIIDLQGWSP